MTSTGSRVHTVCVAIKLIYIHIITRNHIKRCAEGITCLVNIFINQRINASQGAVQNVCQAELAIKPHHWMDINIY